MAGAILQVGGRFWLKHQAKENLVRTKRRSLPAGAIAINISASGDNLDIFGFLSIGVGSVYLILNDFGLASTSNLLFALCLVQSAFLIVIGFETYAVEAENSVEVYMWRLWPLHIKLFGVVMFGMFTMAAAVLSTIATGALDLATASPLLAVSVAVAIYVWRTLDSVTLRHKESRWP